MTKRDVGVIANKFEFDQIQLMKILNWRVKALKRMRTNSELPIAISEILIELEAVYNAGVMAFDGDSKSFLTWLDTYVPALGSVPLKLLENNGIELVKGELLRIEYSVLS